MSRLPLRWCLRTNGGLQCVGAFRRLIVLVIYIVFLEGALGVGNKVLGHVFIASEIASLKVALGGNQPGEDMRIELVLPFVPEELLAVVSEAGLRQDAHPATQLPKLQLVVVIGGIGLNIGLNMEFLVELGEEDAFVEDGLRGIYLVIDFPTLGHDAILNDT